jgi:hypothetical protein
LSLLLGLALVAGVVTAVPSASAATLNATCGVAGQAHTSPAVKIGPNSGTYTFDNFVFACEGTVNGVTDVATSSISTGGNYTNTMCGTGTADSTSASGTITQSVAGNTGATFTAPYHISFTDGVGNLTFNSGASGSGVIDIIPTGPSAPPVGNTNPNSWDCTNSFAVAGEVHLTI